MILAWLLAAAIAANQSAPVPFEKGGLWGYRDAHGTVVIPARYLIADPFSREGIAAVADEKEWTIIDRTGKVLVRPFLFDNGPDEFHEGLARCVEDGKMGFFDKHGRIVIPPRFSYAEPFSGGRAHVCFDCVKVSDYPFSALDSKLPTDLWR